jgi:hypothetical protein
VPGAAAGVALHFDLESARTQRRSQRRHRANQRIAAPGWNIGRVEDEQMFAIILLKRVEGFGPDPHADADDQVRRAPVASAVTSCA